MDRRRGLKTFDKRESTMLGLLTAAGPAGLHFQRLYNLAREHGVTITSTGSSRRPYLTETRKRLERRGLIERRGDNYYLVEFLPTKPARPQFLAEARA